VDSLQHKVAGTSPISHPLRDLLLAQFFGAFNDNAWKLMVALLAIRQATAQMAPGLERCENAAGGLLQHPQPAS
jgi:hypothetical protein